MKHLKGLQRTIMASAIAVLAYGAAPANAAGPFNANTVAGSCAGAPGTDCSTAVGHTDISVAGTLSINEIHAISFGNVTVTGGVAGTVGTAVLTPLGGISLTAAGTGAVLSLLHGANANGGIGGAEHGAAGSDGERPGLYRITGANEGGQTRVYISFATTGGTPLDCNGDSMFPANNVPVLGPGPNNFTVNAFTFTEAGNDVYGHYIVPAGAPAEGTVSGIVFGAVAGLTTADIAVGATLSTSGNAGAYGVGKYEGEFNITASY